ncbi:N-acetylmannosamine kinase [Frankliniella fusca]|uniref:N-acetylmannosamine kinase n=1 Tax=Frankliniella fusca TaxID=407009 RepID=A0AAE1HQM2_9NEOP|nr:N-acetylmannosamine kinase [Frankliniella fusca]
MKRQFVTEHYERVHAPGEARCDKLYNDMGKIMAKYSGETTTPEKREYSDADARSFKMLKEDDS